MFICLRFTSIVFTTYATSQSKEFLLIYLFRYGKKIFDKMMEAMQPAFEDETPINPFDFWEGAEFKLKIRKVDGFWN